jgi:hypothetical protein
MKRSRNSEEKILCALKQAESGTPVRDVCREKGISAVRGCGHNLGLVWVAYPSFARYSMGLREPGEVFVRLSLYQRMYESTSAMKCSMVVACQLPG